MGHILENAAEELAGKIGNPVSNFEKGYEAGIMEAIELLETLYGKVVSLDDLDEIASEVYKEKQKEYNGSSIMTNMHTAYLDVAPVIQDGILNGAMRLARKRAEAVEDENRRISGIAMDKESVAYLSGRLDLTRELKMTIEDYAAANGKKPKISAYYESREAFIKHEQGIGFTYDQAADMLDHDKKAFMVLPDDKGVIRFR